MPNERKGGLNAKGLRLGIIVSRFNSLIMDRVTVFVGAGF